MMVLKKLLYYFLSKQHYTLKLPHPPVILGLIMLLFKITGVLQIVLQSKKEWKFSKLQPICHDLEDNI